jgi:hypothetical protein
MKEMQFSSFLKILYVELFRQKGLSLINCSSKLSPLNIFLTGACQQIFFYLCLARRECLFPLENLGLDDDFNGWGIFIDLRAYGR